MALENVLEIEKALGIDSGKLTEMITSEESHSIDLSELLIEKKPFKKNELRKIKEKVVIWLMRLEEKKKETQ